MPFDGARLNGVGFDAPPTSRHIRDNGNATVEMRNLFDGSLANTRMHFNLPFQHTRGAPCRQSFRARNEKNKIFKFEIGTTATTVFN